jgi:hypothetical protein
MQLLATRAAFVLTTNSLHSVPIDAIEAGCQINIRLMD